MLLLRRFFQLLYQATRQSGGVFKKPNTQDFEIFIEFAWNNSLNSSL